ncbi:hypothetical protein DSECCO2_337220 [anaerobic digester metagenome]|jgi:heparin/heparan-sulfate lyase
MDFIVLFIVSDDTYFMVHKYVFSTLLLLFLSASLFSQQKDNSTELSLTSKEARINPNTVRRTSNDQLLELKDSIKRDAEGEVWREADITFPLRIPQGGRYLLSSHVKRTQFPNGPVNDLNIEIQIGNQRITKRIVSDARNYTYHVLGDFVITESDSLLRVWLPKGIQFEKIVVNEYCPVTVPETVQIYQPPIVPPEGHPRLWVNGESLPVVKARLDKGENHRVWQQVKKDALQEFTFHFYPWKEIPYSTDLEKTVQTKAFYYLMTDEKKVGREAISILKNYLSVLEYGNINYGDITRDIGHTIYVSALVYDWCNGLLTKQEKKQLYERMMDLSRKMSIGWPPFKESIVNGHAAEAQVNRDLLSMSIAIYEQDPIPYKYTSYLILEELVPMRRFQYQSARPNQGVDYGAYRHMWEMNAAWLFYRMSGRQVFDDNIKKLPLYWMYMRLPNGRLFRDGDVFREVNRMKPYYWGQPEMLLLDYCYSENAILKAEFQRQGGIPDNPILFLLLNNPELIPSEDYSHFPLAFSTGNVTGSLISRTGWNMKPGSDDVVAEIKGGGYLFGNHQHADAGAIQIYYHGLQVCDLGLYISYGSPYDFNFNKRSASHSMMLVVDPDEAFGNNLLNDGGTRFNQRSPKSVFDTLHDPWFSNGVVLASNIEHNNNSFQYSYFKADLTHAYSSKVRNYTKTFCFVNTGNKQVPAFIVVLDNITSSNADFKKFWKINTIKEPLISDSSILLHNREETGPTGWTHIKTLLPAKANRKTVYWNSQDTVNPIAPLPAISTHEPETKGYQLVISPQQANKKDTFLNLFLMAADGVRPPLVHFDETSTEYRIKVHDYLVVLPSKSELLPDSFDITLLDHSDQKVILAGLKPGLWYVCKQDNNTHFKFKVKENANSLQFSGNHGTYKIWRNNPDSEGETQ